VHDDELLALAAPKRVLIVAPEFDRCAPVDDVRAEVEEGRKVYRALGGEDALELRTPTDFNRFPRSCSRRCLITSKKRRLVGRRPRNPPVDRR
jgi:hypothetical protein